MVMTATIHVVLTTLSATLSLFSLPAHSLSFFHLSRSFCSSVPLSLRLTPSTYNLREPFYKIKKSNSFAPFYSHPLHKHTHHKQQPNQQPSSAAKHSDEKNPLPRMVKTTKHPAPAPTPTVPAVPDSTSSSNSSSSSSISIQSAPYQGIGSWFGDFNALCVSSCVPLPTCNLLSATAAADSFEKSAPALGAETGTGMETWNDDQCLNSGGWPVRDVGSVVVSVLGLLFVVRQIFVKSRRMFAAVGTFFLTFAFFNLTVKKKKKKEYKQVRKRRSMYCSLFLVLAYTHGHSHISSPMRIVA